MPGRRIRSGPFNREELAENRPGLVRRLGPRVPAGLFLFGPIPGVRVRTTKPAASRLSGRRTGTPLATMPSMSPFLNDTGGYERPTMLSRAGRRQDRGWTAASLLGKQRSWRTITLGRLRPLRPRDRCAFSFYEPTLCPLAAGRFPPRRNGTRPRPGRPLCRSLSGRRPLHPPPRRPRRWRVPVCKAVSAGLLGMTASPYLG